jgi:hypothetical protein
VRLEISHGENLDLMLEEADINARRRRRGLSCGVTCKLHQVDRGYRFVGVKWLDAPDASLTKEQQ